MESLTERFAQNEQTKSDAAKYREIRRAQAAQKVHQQGLASGFDAGMNKAYEAIRGYLNPNKGIGVQTPAMDVNATNPEIQYAEDPGGLAAYQANYNKQKGY